MNREHLELCSSDKWMTHLGTTVVPWVLERVTVAGDVLEIGPGPGAATNALRAHARRLLAVEHDPQLAAALADRFAADPVVEVRQGDATALDLPDGAVDMAASFTMLHHVPSEAEQDQVFAEMARVLRPGGTFFGVDSLGGPSFLAFHHDDVCVPLDPGTLADRLEAAGFTDVDVAVSGDGVRWIAATPEADGARVRVNQRFVDLYTTEEVQRLVAEDWVPQLLDIAALGEDPLHLAAGPATASAALRAVAPRLTVAELDPAFVATVAARHHGDPEVDVRAVDPTALPFDGGRFTAATTLLTLTHLPSRRTLDRTLRELARVLRPGAPFVGLNPIDGSHLRSLTEGDRATVIDPFTFGAQLEAAGFTDVHVDLWAFPRFVGRAP